MIIVFFHVLYLIGRMMYENYHSAKRKDADADVEESQRPANLAKKRYAVDPFVDYPEDFGEGPKVPRFNPPAYIQRYVAVQKVLVDPRYQGKIKKVVDFGCSELGFINHLKNTPGIEEILFVDVDRATLENNKTKVIPLNADYLHHRPNPFSIYVYEGSVTQRDKRLEKSDAVVAIELIEHLYPDTLIDFPYNIFGYIKPLVAIFTTPNAEFNVLFSLGNEMRHWDHKFEWTRQQFEDWANNIVSRYPEYQVSFEGIGPGETGTEHLGCCSQMAVFTRMRESEALPIYGMEGLFKSVTHQEYPYRVDNRSDEQKILDEASYYIRRFMQCNPDCLEEYPLKELLEHLDKFYISAETLREILENGGYPVVDLADGAAIICPPLSTFSDYDDELGNDDIEDAWDVDFVRENSPYRDNFGTWTAYNVEGTSDECWDDDDYEIPATNLPANAVTRSPDEPRENVAVEFELSLTRSLDTADLNGIEISNVSHVTSTLGSIELDGLSRFQESLESTEENTREDANISANTPSTGNQILNQNQNSSVERKTEAVNTIYESSSFLGQSKSSSPQVAQSLAECSVGTEDSQELGSLCSMYLEASRNDERDACPVNITNPSFDCTGLECSLEESRNSVDAISSESSLDCVASEIQIRGRLPSVRNDELIARPQFASSPRAIVECRELGKAQISACREDPVDSLKSMSQASLRSNGNFSSATSSGSSFSNLRKFYPPEENSVYRNVDAAKLKGGNEAADYPVEEITSEGGEISSSESFEATNVLEELHVTRLARQRAPEILELRSTNSSKELNESLPIDNTITPSTCSKESPTTYAQQHDVNAHINAQTPRRVDSIVRLIDESLAASPHKSNSGRIEEYNRSRLPEASEAADIKPASPDASETPPNSWSPEIMDSGYPNSSSTQDMTPEYDLSSIAQDRISDSESPSVAEAPRLGFLDHADVENGDLANNNRDDEGNNMMAEAENDLDEDLQPLIDVLENDMENENDIYAIENGFPIWLLRILERGNAAGRQAVAERADLEDGFEADAHAAGDAGIPDLDEGFDSTSSEDENVEEASTESSEETIDWNAGGDYY